ncbi:MAG TPA: NAD-binding protein, partial [Candidatus Limnocylindrales bacterium]|nr:NAD-binding protein [Candidatus Limnocylindrales bacterium]
MRARLSSIFASPIIRRIAWYTRRAQKSLDRRFFISLGTGIVIFVGIAAVAVTLLEKPWTFESLGSSFYWGLTTVFGQGDASYITSPGGWIVSWLLILFGVALLGTITGALVAFVIDFLLKEGQGMGAAGYSDHIVICGWNSTARDLVEELHHDEYKAQIVLVHDVDRSPAGSDVYYVRGDATIADDLERAGIRTAQAAIIFPSDGTDAADMRSILIVMAIEALAPEVRTVVEVNNPRHEVHLKRANADEVLVTSSLASHLLARSALYPGLSSLVTDIVSGGEGAELYRVSLPAEYCGLTVDALSATMRREHRATLLSINRGGHTFANPPADFGLLEGDDAVVLAESLSLLAPLKLERIDRT